MKKEENWRKRNQNEENERKPKIEKHSDYNFFYRINPDEEGFDIILKLVKYITQSNKEKLEKEKEPEITELKKQQSAINQITNNFGKITIKNW